MRTRFGMKARVFGTRRCASRTSRSPTRFRGPPPHIFRVPTDVLGPHGHILTRWCEGTRFRALFRTRRAGRSRRCASRTFRLTGALPEPPPHIFRVPTSVLVPRGHILSSLCEGTRFRAVFRTRRAVRRERARRRVIFFDVLTSHAPKNSMGARAIGVWRTPACAKGPAGLLTRFLLRGVGEVTKK